MKSVHRILAFASAAAICVAVHAHAVTYYVNDSSIAEDQWCSAPGNDANSGTSPVLPKRTLQAVLNAYDLEPGDNVYIDTGYYLLTNNIHVTFADSGASNALVTFQGSTNGTVVDRGSQTWGDYGITLDNVQYIRLADLLLTNGFWALYLTNAEYCNLDRVTVRSAADVGVHLEESEHNRIRGIDVSGCKDGVYMFRSSFNSLLNSLIWSNRGDGVYLRDAPSGTSVDSCTIAFNGYKQIDLTGSGTFVTLSNSIVVAQGKGNYCISAYEGYISPGYIGDHNNLWATDGASIGGFEYEDSFFYRLGNWQKKTGRDMSSLSCDPLFADPGTGNFHLKSTQGRYAGSGIWMADAVHSPCIDSGDPSSDWSSEPSPNGARRNMGAYANTSEASLSDTEPRLHVLNLYSGGQLWGNTVNVQWVSWNISATETVRLDYSIDGGTTWSTVVQGVSVSAGTYKWVPDHGLQRDMLYRVVLESNPSIMDMCDGSFMHIPYPMTFYVNDADTSNDVYCTAPGSEDNDGLSPDRPRASVEKVINENNFRPGDSVLIDTGHYWIMNAIRIGSDRVNSSDDRGMRLVGSPAGSTIEYAGTEDIATISVSASEVYIAGLIVTGGCYGIDAYYASGLVISDLTVQGAKWDGIKIQSSPGIRLEDIVIRHCEQAGKGLYIQRCDGAIVQRVLVEDTAGYGVVLELSDYCRFSRIDVKRCGYAGISVQGSSFNQFIQCLSWGNDGPGLEFLSVDNGYFWSRHLRPSDSNLVEYSTIAYNRTTAQVYEKSEYGRWIPPCGKPGPCQYWQWYRHGYPTTFSNNIIATSGSNNYCIGASQDHIHKESPAYRGNYNNFFLGNGASVAYVQRDPGYVWTYDTPGEWKLAFGQDQNSVFSDPLFADVEGGDLHLQSTAGRFVRTGVWTNDGAYSPCIDAGEPASPYGNEPAPNGRKANLGRYGNTDEASKSDRQPRIWITTLNDEDLILMGEARTIAWNYAGIGSNQTVKIEYGDSNASGWRTIATGVPITAGAYEWNTTWAEPVEDCVCRISVESQPLVSDLTDTPFVLRGHSFYVNDKSTLRDVFCNAKGRWRNSGLTPSSPLACVFQILVRYDFVPGDTVYIDTGVYNPYTNLVFSRKDSGTKDSAVVLQGSPNGSVISRDSIYKDSTLHVRPRVSFFELRDLTFLNGFWGVYLEGVSNCVLSNVTIRNASDVGLHMHESECCDLVGLDIAYCKDGIYMNASRGNEMHNSIIWRNRGDGVRLSWYSRDNYIHSCTVALNGYKQFDLTQGSSVRLRNSIVVAAGSGNSCLYAYTDYPRDPPWYDSDYNDLYAYDGASVYGSGSSRTSDTYHVTLSDWQEVFNQDLHSISTDPLFVWDDGNFHLRSNARRGTYLELLGIWMRFPQNSPCIDAGNPSEPFENEPAPNGFVLNLGAYGNTREASRSFDSDGDGLSDSFERRFLQSNPDSSDTDGDGDPDGEEFLAGVSLADPASRFVIGVDRCAGPDSQERLVLSWPSIEGRRYRLEYSPDLLDGFRGLTDDLPACPPMNVYTTDVDDVGRAFFRVRVQR